MGGLSEIVEDGHSGWLIPPDSPQALADAIFLASRDRAKLIEFGRCGRKRAEGFSAAIMVSRMEAFYQRLVGAEFHSGITSSARGECAMTKNAFSDSPVQCRPAHEPGSICNARSCHKILLAVTILLLTSHATSLAQNSGTFRLVSVRVEGSKQYEASEIVRAAGLKVSQSITPDALKEAAGKLGALGIFAQVSFTIKLKAMR